MGEAGDGGAVVLQHQLAGALHQQHFRIAGEARVVRPDHLQHAEGFAAEAMREVEAREVEARETEAITGLSGGGTLQRLTIFLEVFDAAAAPFFRSEERRVGKECVSTCRYRGSPEP